MAQEISVHELDKTSIVTLRELAVHLQNAGIEAYLVGGFIRDSLISRAGSDIDIAVKGDALVIGSGLAGALDGKFVPLDINHKIGRIITSSGQENDIDISTFTGEIFHDLARRDFTINAMAIDLQQFAENKEILTIIDPFSGFDDLARGLIRVVTPAAFQDDAVRLLRAVRFSAELGFRIEPLTEQQLKHSVPELQSVAAERIRDEILALLEGTRGEFALRYLDETGLLSAIFPEMDAGRGIKQPDEHFWDVFQHSLATVKAIDAVLGYGVWEHVPEKTLAAIPWSGGMAAYFAQPVSAGSRRRTLLKLSALLHDIAKPQTLTIEDNGKMRFLGHSEIGAGIVNNIMKRLRFSSKESNLVDNVVKYHLRPTQMGEIPSRRAVFRFYRDTADAARDILYFSLADHLATRGPGLIKENWILHTATVRHIMEEYDRQQSVVIPQKLVDGNDLMNCFGLPPGPEIGKLLQKLQEAQAVGEITDRQAALAYIRNQLTEGKI